MTTKDALKWLIAVSAGVFTTGRAKAIREALSLMGLVKTYSEQLTAEDWARLLWYFVMCEHGAPAKVIEWGQKQEAYWKTAAPGDNPLEVLRVLFSHRARAEQVKAIAFEPATGVAMIEWVDGATFGFPRRVGEAKDWKNIEEEKIREIVLLPGKIVRDISKWVRLRDIEQAAQIQKQAEKKWDEVFA